jgi:hypothetical protein
MSFTTSLMRSFWAPLSMLSSECRGERKEEKMSRPKYLYKIDDKTVAYSGSGNVLTIQQGDLISDSSPDKCIFLDRANLVRLRDAIDEFLNVPA